LPFQNVMQRMVNSPQNTEQLLVCDTLGLLHPDRHSMQWFTNLDSIGYLDNYERFMVSSDVNKHFKCESQYLQCLMHQIIYRILKYKQTQNTWTYINCMWIFWFHVLLLLIMIKLDAWTVPFTQSHSHVNTFHWCLMQVYW
jgi:hypothetical protein